MKPPARKAPLLAALALLAACSSAGSTPPPTASAAPPSHYQRVVACVQQQGAPGLGNNPQAALATLGCAKGTGALTGAQHTCAVKVARARYPLARYEHALAACWR